MTLSGESFYTVPEDAAKAPPGTLLKVEKDVDTSKYTLPPATALSRVMYQSENLNGSRVPASAYVLWPYSSRSQPDRYSIVAWAFPCPVPTCTSGYVFIATDYAGLGVDRHTSRETIIHEYMACLSHANDVIYSVEAAQAAFPELSRKFFVIRHSQGGGAAWATAQRQVARPVPGYLGAVAVSSVSNILEVTGSFLPIIVVGMCPGLASAFPDFKIIDILAPDSEKRIEAVLQTEAGVVSAAAVLSEEEILQPNWRQVYRSLMDARRSEALFWSFTGSLIYD